MTPMSMMFYLLDRRNMFGVMADSFFLAMRLMAVLANDA